ncbi:LNS2 domain-containing protein [Anaeromyxobacter terrae]|uniref:LNS2 domain-containing protein n=1 Tax=Anaeromyxobacter terrae TaxID=2925406 RepID=UPI001F57DAEC|nr:hypothetical protein [Anaeromyxobacter sp. SG22]
MRSAAALLLLAAACQLPATGPEETDQTGPAGLAWCVGAPFTPAPAKGFAYDTNALLAALGSPGHSMQDVVAVDGASIVVHGKFAYGTVSKDLEGERVRVYLDDCSGWRALGEATTDSDGRIAVAVGALPAGVYDVRLEVLGDASVAPGRIWVLPRGARLAVTDIDGTLTTSDEELVQDVLTDLFAPIFTGNDVPEAYPGAAALTRALSGRGYVLVYLTGRPYWLAAKTRAWLAAGDFAPGALHTTDSNTEALPTEAGVGAYKLAFLEGLRAQGFVLEEAYGNATTDVYAYAGAGVPAERTWIIGPNGGAGGTNAVAGSWEARAAEVRALPAVEQPFTP